MWPSSASQAAMRIVAVHSALSTLTSDGQKSRADCQIDELDPLKTFKSLWSNLTREKMEWSSDQIRTVPRRVNHDMCLHPTWTSGGSLLAPSDVRPARGSWIESWCWENHPKVVKKFPSHFLVIEIMQSTLESNSRFPGSIAVIPQLSQIHDITYVDHPRYPQFQLIPSKFVDRPTYAQFQFIRMHPNLFKLITQVFHSYTKSCAVTYWCWSPKLPTVPNLPNVSIFDHPSHP